MESIATCVIILLNIMWLLQLLRLSVGIMTKVVKRNVFLLQRLVHQLELQEDFLLENLGEHQEDSVLVVLQRQLLDSLLNSQQHKLPRLSVALELKQPRLVPHQHLA
jgi:hypothetical protein